MRVAITLGTGLLFATWWGCGTTKWTDTARTATEQLLVTDSIDRAVSRLDLRALAGKKVFVDDTPAKQVTDNAYLTSAIRQHVLASGAILKDKRDDADYILEVRAGAVGTDRHDLLFGIPPTTLPTISIAPAAPTQIPEIAVAKKTDQRGVAKISMFAYNKETGRPVWQSGAIPEESWTKALWVLGAGPFQRGTIHRGTTFAGAKVRIPLIDPMLADEEKQTAVAVADEAYFVEPKEPSPSVAKGPVAGAPGKDQAAAAAPTPGKDQAAAAPVSPAKDPPAAAPAAGPPSGTLPVRSAPAAAPGPQDVRPASTGPDFPTGPAGPGRFPANAFSPDRRVERIGEVTSGPALVESWPAGELRPSGRSGDVSPAGALMPAGSYPATGQPAEEVFRGDTWLDRRR